MLIERGDRPAEVERIKGYDGIDVTQDGELVAVFTAERKYAMGGKPFKTAMNAEGLEEAIHVVSEHLQDIQDQLKKNDGEIDSNLSGNFNATKHVLAELEHGQAAIMSIPDGFVENIRQRTEEMVHDERRNRGLIQRVVEAVTNG